MAGGEWGYGGIYGVRGCRRVEERDNAVMSMRMKIEKAMICDI